MDHRKSALVTQRPLALGLWAAVVLALWGREFGCVAAAAETSPAAATPPRARGPEAMGKVSFTRDIEPILREFCSECHGAKRQKGGLRLDLRSAALRGSDSGPVIVPGRSSESRLIQLVAGVNPDEIMPPRGERLSPAQVELLRLWIDAGALWPDGLTAAEAGSSASDHWSLEPLKESLPPPPENLAWKRNEIDSFVLARLEAAALLPSPEADRVTLIRRLSLDLLGLPPAPDEVEDFLGDPSPRAYEKLVERLLASPRYGERWGRHWLDVARFTESQGFEYDRLRDNAWHYRDYVVSSFNTDRPYDRFVREQIAGDVLEPVTSDGIVATSLLVCGPWDQAGNSQANKTQKAITREEEMEDLISVVTQTFIGMTVNCARCHSHKFDPIPQTDYYRIKAVFDGVVHGERSISTAAELAARAARIDQLERAVAAARARLAEIDAVARQAVIERRAPQRQVRPGPLPIARWTFDDGNATDVVGNLDGTLHGGATVAAGRLVLKGDGAFLESAPLERDLGEKTLEAWVSLATLDEGGGGVITLETQGGAVFDAVVFGERQKRKWLAGSNGFVRSRDLDAPEEEARPGEMIHMAIVYRRDGVIAVYRNGRPYGDPYKAEASPAAFRANDARVLLGRRHTGGGRAFLRGEIDAAALYDRALAADEVDAAFRAAGAFVTTEELLAAMSAADLEERGRRVREVSELEARLEAVPPVPVSYAGLRQQPPATRRLVGGSVTAPAEEVAPGALSAITTPSGEFGLAVDAPEAERRRQLADWLADERHPLTARVMANRIWHYHFGRGIVATPNDFGASGARPTHPGLLDWLARRLVESGWSVKALHRLILTSATYRQASSFDAAAAAVDADNRLLWRFPPRRLEAEVVRDSMLAVSGQIHLAMGGPSFRPFTVSRFGSSFYTPEDRIGPEFNRRTTYRMNVNSGKSPLLDVLDCPDPAVKTPVRRVTTTPLQALSLMNSSFVERQARHFAALVLRRAAGDVAGAIDLACRRVYGRPASEHELESLTLFARQHGMEAACWVLLNTSEFLYVR